VSQSGNQTPEELEAQVGKAVDLLCKSFGEHTIAGPRHPGRDHRFHQKRDVDVARAAGLKTLKEQLERWAPKPGPKRLQVLIYLFNKSWELWDLTLAYHTLNVLEEAVGEFVGPAGAPSEERLAQDWDPALRAVRQAMTLIIADTDIFKAINLSSAKDLATAADAGVKATKTIASDLKSLGPLPRNGHDDTSLLGDLAGIAKVARQSHIFYAAIAGAARALIEFESWLAAVPRLGSLPDSSAGGSSDSPPTQGKVLEKIDAAKKQFEDAHSKRGEDALDPLTLERSEPWLRLLVEIRQIVEGAGEITASSGATGTAAEDAVDQTSDISPDAGAGSDGKQEATVVFVPKRVSIRYCYPFAVGTNEPIRPILKDLERKHLDQAFERKPKKTSEGLSNKMSEGLLGVSATGVKPLAATQFFAQDAGLYGGVRVDLPDIEFTRYAQLNGVDSNEKAGRCKVWVDLSDMGNHCLCIQPEQLKAPLPHLLYRAVRAGIPSSLGETVDLADKKTHAKDVTQPQPDTETGWDSLHLFSQDIIASIALADFWKHDEGTRHDEDTRHDKDTKPFERGNLHEIIVVRTEEPLDDYPEDIAKRLDSAIGGKILLRSIQRTASTLEEWVQYPRLPRPGGPGRKSSIEGIPEMGLDGDWCTHTGETTVFGIVAAPSWHYAVYVEGAQFVSSWNPLLRLWSRRLRNAIEASQPDADALKGSEELRPIEKQVHLHLMQISAEELCATQAHRRFLDQLLEMSQLKRLQAELESELTAAEHLTDWIDQEQHKKSEKRRVVLLGVIALLGIFGLSGFLGFANDTHAPFMDKKPWEDAILLAVFLVAVTVGIRYDVFEVNTWLKRHLSFGKALQAFVKKARRPTRAEAISDE
jgi:hypothetical protein